jgi:protein-tyrosine phosphatase
LIVALVEIIDGKLFQSDANPAVAVKLEERGVRRAVVFDLCGLEERIEPVSDRIVCVRWPIEDGPIADGEMLRALALFGAQAIAGGSAAVAMCEMGRNRSGLLAAMIASHVCEVSGAEAMALVRARNPEAIANRWFEEFLRRG